MTHHGWPPALAAALGFVVFAAPVAGPAQTALRPPEDFAAIPDPAARSAAIFTEAARVIASPRCLNCHPQGRSPTQGDDLHPHAPFVTAAEGGHGAPGLPCASCHQAENVRTYGAVIETMPGHPHWSLAPEPMAWQGLSLGEICRQIQDPARNGGRTLAQIHEHMAHDDLVGWAWRPGVGRTSAPGTQEAFGRLIEAWIKTGAACPNS